MGKDVKKECDFCSGTGQVVFFKGESRFLLSEEECTQCGGLGFVFIEEDPKTTGNDFSPEIDIPRDE
jgi:DnaJ-class molecular chaperone